MSLKAILDCGKEISEQLNSVKIRRIKHIKITQQLYEALTPTVNKQISPFEYIYSVPFCVDNTLTEPYKIVYEDEESE